MTMEEKTMKVKHLVALMLALGINANVYADPKPQDVNVVNTPDVNVVGTPGVTVENDSTKPVPVKLTDPITVNTGNAYQYVGMSTTATLPDIGINGMHETCQSDHGPTARMCTTDEVFQTLAIPLSPTALFEPPMIALIGPLSRVVLLLRTG